MEMSKWSYDHDSIFYLLRQILEKRAPLLARLLNSGMELDDIDFNDRLAICDALTDEFSETGLDSSYEPNDRGLLIEHLIDIVNPSGEPRKKGR
jgi:hypothetical protein